MKVLNVYPKQCHPDKNRKNPKMQIPRFQRQIFREIRNIAGKQKSRINGLERLNGEKFSQKFLDRARH